MSKHIISPSILAADYSDIRTEIQKINESGAQYIHLDVMDGHFVPNITFGPQFISQIRPYSRLFFDTHLMMDNPSGFIQQFAESGSDGITVHAEACIHLDKVIESIHLYGCKAGVAIVPSTPVSMLDCILDIADIILVMSVNPGFGGQSFIRYSLDKIRTLKEIRGSRKYIISADGGISLSNIADIWDAGCDIAVAGSSFFSSADKKAFVTEMLKE